MRKSTIMLIGFTALVLITLLTTIFITDKVSAVAKPQSSYTTLVVKRVHGDIYKFRDGNRECYFSGKGGIWCTP